MLLIHIIGAIILAAISIVSVVMAFQKETRSLSIYATTVAIGSALQIGSGVVLSLSQGGSLSLLAYCSRVGAYLAVVAVVEGLLLYKMRKQNQPFPTELVASPLIAALLVVVIAA